MLIYFEATQQHVVEFEAAILREEYAFFLLFLLPSYRRLLRFVPNAKGKNETHSWVVS